MYLSECKFNSFSIFAEELIKSIFDYQLARIFNNKTRSKNCKWTASKTFLGNKIIEILEEELKAEKTEIQIITVQTRTQIKILVKLKDEKILYNLDGEQKVDVGILFKYKIKNKKKQKK